MRQWTGANARMHMVSATTAESSPASFPRRATHPRSRVILAELFRTLAILSYVPGKIGRIFRLASCWTIRQVFLSL